MKRVHPVDGAAAFALLNVIAAVSSVVLVYFNRVTLVAEPGQPIWLVAAGQVVGPALLVVILSVFGIRVVSRAPANPLGWAWLLTMAAIAIELVLCEYAVMGLLVNPGSLPQPALAARTQSLIWVAVPMALMICVGLFPDGRFAFRHWRWMLGVAGVVTGAAVISELADTRPLNMTIRDGSLLVAMPPEFWTVSGPISDWFGGSLRTALDNGAYWGRAALVPVAAGAAVLRSARADPVVRQQLKWVGFASAIAGAGWAVGHAAELPAANLLFGVASWTVAAWGKLIWQLGITVLTPLAGGIAIVRYRLYYIDVLIHRTLILLGLSLVVTGTYVVTVLVFGAALNSAFNPFVALLATIIVAVAFAPARDRLALLANRIVYGRREAPYEVLSSFGKRVSQAIPASDLTTAIGRVLCLGTGAASAEVWLRIDDELRLSSRWPADGNAFESIRLDASSPAVLPHWTHHAPVTREGELLGVLAVESRPGDRIADRERKLVDDLASQVALVLENRQLLEEVRASRERIVRAHDEERRSIERNLHDGAQQQFVIAGMHVSLAEKLIQSQRAEAAGAELAAAKRQVDEGLANLRGVARGLLPEILVTGGLGAALRLLADRSPLPVDLEVEPHARYPDPVERTLYYVVAEALTNVAKHSRASSVSIRCWRDGFTVRLIVSDDGIGGARIEPGSGLQGLRDRLSSFGGSMGIISAPGKGTQLSASLPLEGSSC